MKPGGAGTRKRAVGYGGHAMAAVLWFTSATFAQIPPENVHVVANWDEHPPSYLAADVWADDRGYAYVANRTGATIDIMDVSDPANPTLITIYQVPPPNNNANAKDVKVHNELMFIGLDDDGWDGAQIVSVHDPADPQFLVNITIPDFEDIHNLFYDSGYLYLVDSRDPEMAVVDLTEFDPDNPPAQTITQAKWVIEDVGSVFVHDVTVAGGRAYLAAWNSGIWVYDVGDIANQPPVFVASAPGSSTHAAWPTPDKRFIVTNEERIDGGPVKLYEMTEDGDAATLTHVFTYSIPLSDAPSSHNVYVVGYRVYCAWYNRGLMAFDIDPEFGRLELVAHFDTSVNKEVYHGAWGVYPFLGRDKIMVSDKETQFWIFDVRIPGSGDFNGDADRDFEDFAALQLCFSGADTPYTDPACEIFDTDDDLDVDLDDFAEFQQSLTGPR